MLRRAVAVAVISCSLAAAGAAAAKAPKEPRKKAPQLPRVAIVELGLEGDASPELRRQVEKSLAGGFAAAGFECVGFDAVAEKMKTHRELVGCTTTDCLERIGKLVGAEKFVKGKIDASGATYTFELTVLPEGRKVSEQCVACSIADANDKATALGTRAMTAAPASGHVTIEASVKGAQLFADNEPIGETATDVELEPGDHVFKATASGYKPREISKTVASGEKVSISMELEPLPVDKIVVGPPPVVEQGPSRFGPWKWAAGGAALALVATGVTFLVLDGRETDCATGQACAHAYDTGTGGMVLTVAGLAAGGVAVWMFMNDHPRPPPVKAALVPIPGGAGVLLQGRF